AGTIYDRDYLAGNLRGGDAYDWYYVDDVARAAQTRTPITDSLGKPWVFRAKDLWSWWSSAHYERVGGSELGAHTGWVPQSKPIWLTEIGCPAVEKGANQPSVFPDPKSAESGVPYFSTGKRDDLIQRRVLEAALQTFDPAHGATTSGNPISSVYGGRMLEPSAIHLWTWDARPYPFFPAALDVWNDGPNWDTGHWLTGRLGGAPRSNLAAGSLGRTRERRVRAAAERARAHARRRDRARCRRAGAHARAARDRRHRTAPHQRALDRPRRVRACRRNTAPSVAAA